MLSLISLGSSSKGNCHILYNGHESIMLDCGINMNKYNFEVTRYNIQGILITHSHQDHCKGLKGKSYRGNQNVYANDETMDFLGDSIMDYRKNVVQEMKAFDVGNDFRVVPIEVIHDVKNYGYIIHDKRTNMNIAYFTDLGYSDNLIIKGINVWIIECNHVRSEVESKLEYAIENENDDKYYYSRTLSDKGHLCLEDSCKLIKNNYGLGLKHIILCHISNSEGDYKRYDNLYMEELKRIEIELKNVKIHSINNHINDIETYDIIPKNKWEGISL
jgi:phosphoribosyl 1,2-cyclic phosphodiesterase